jgi:hypothetical protein
LILTNQLSREDALQQIANPPYDESQAMKDLTYICRKLSIPKEEFLALMHQPNQTFKNYKNSSNWIALAVWFARVLKVETRQYR